jgi:hypothetical protein
MNAHEAAFYTYGQSEQEKEKADAMHLLCEDGGDVATSSLLENWIDQAQRRMWFLFERTVAEIFSDMFAESPLHI